MPPVDRGCVYQSLDIQYTPMAGVGPQCPICSHIRCRGSPDTTKLKGSIRERYTLDGDGYCTEVFYRRQSRISDLKREARIAGGKHVIARPNLLESVAHCPLVSQSLICRVAGFMLERSERA